MRPLTAVCFLASLLQITNAVAQKGEDATLKRAETTITSPHLLDHIRVLSSDAYTGRAPGTEGESKSLAYIIAQCKAIGLEPGNPDGSWTQTVNLWGVLSRGTLALEANGKDFPAQPDKDYIAFSYLPDAKITVPSTGLVFVGYGAVAPEYHWDDYAGIDVHGKTVVLFLGDPPVADPQYPAKLDESMFNGKALSVYGRGGTKLDAAFKHGAAAVILLTAGPQAAPPMIQNYQRELMTLRGPEARARVQAVALLNSDRAAEYFEAAGADFAALKAAAAKPGFRPVALDGQASFEITSKIRQVDSANVVAKIPGSDPKLRNQYVIYSAHWDHHGKVGDNIYHGASDNAAGTAGILELARAFKSMQPAPRRTMLFLWPTAEEKGLLGARWYVEHPLYPLTDTLANINLDYFSNWGWGKTHDFSIVGIGNSTLDDLTVAAVKAQGRVVTGDTAPEQGFYFRSDHYEFARVGVPSIETSPGIDYIGKPADFGERMRAEYIAHDYHQPSDVIKPGWDLSGAVEDLQVLLDVGYRVAQQDSRPTWKKNAVWRPKPE
ncbi:MAG: M20/M25/M40 family metallo-hydrolase [Acidobacteriota bacterium]|nr:M20/M25/M40 family metallo-hydrolase [Acidobacteriota bacterium]